MTQHTHAHSKTIESPISHTISRAWYWVVGGILECGQRALSADKLIAFEFLSSGVLLINGVMLLIPGAMAGWPFTRVMQADIFHSGYHLPLWFFGIQLIIVARVMIHYTLRDEPTGRSNALAATSIAWGSLLFLNVLTGSAAYGSALLAALFIFTLALFLRVELGRHGKQKTTFTE